MNDEKTKALVYTTIEAYPLEPSIKSNYDVISDDEDVRSGVIVNLQTSGKMPDKVLAYCCTEIIRKM